MEPVIVYVCDDHLGTVDSAQIGQRCAEVAHVANLRDGHLVMDGALV